MTDFCRSVECRVLGVEVENQFRVQSVEKGLFVAYVDERAGRRVAIGFQEGVRYKARVLRNTGGPADGGIENTQGNR